MKPKNLGRHGKRKSDLSFHSPLLYQLNYKGADKILAKKNLKIATVLGPVSVNLLVILQGEFLVSMQAHYAFDFGWITSNLADI